MCIILGDMLYINIGFRYILQRKAINIMYHSYEITFLFIMYFRKAGWNVKLFNTSSGMYKQEFITTMMPLNNVYSTSEELCTGLMLCYLLCIALLWYGGIHPHPSGLLHWHGGNLTIAPVLVKQPRRIWVNKSYQSIGNGDKNTTKQNTTTMWARLIGYTMHF